MIRPQKDIMPVAVVQEGPIYWRFVDPVGVITTADPAEIPAAVAQIEQAVETEGLFAAGYLTYEAGAAYGLEVHSPAAADPPLLWFGLFRGREPYALPPVDSAAPDAPSFGPWHASVSRETYLAGIRRIKAEIAAGYTYQANYTFRLRATFSGDPAALYGRLARAQSGGYSAYLDTGRHVIVSASPELFFRLDGERLVSKPMKGTAPRGLAAADDQAQAAWLRASEKNRAENVMIVDMVRNDLGRVARTGTVRVPSLFDVERYPTVLQMTSTVEGQTAVPLNEMMAALFPCASITGAPKVSTMRLIRRLETDPRGVYCGAVGFVAPGRRVQFNVAIRTVVIDRETDEAVYGVGSGVVWDSDAADEYDECLLKARVLSRPPSDAAAFSLLESLRWTPERGYDLLERHLARMAASAEYFVYPFEPGAARAALASAAAALTEDTKVRLLLAADGVLSITTEPLAAGDRPEPVRIGPARLPVNSGDVWLYHKTTQRRVYADALASRPDCDDVILWNERGELTETTIYNLVLELDGELLTPPVSSGLLPGTLRAAWLEAGVIAERVLTLDDLQRAEAIYLINSVRGRRRAVLV